MWHNKLITFSGFSSFIFRLNHKQLRLVRAVTFIAVQHRAAVCVSLCVVVLKRFACVHVVRWTSGESRWGAAPTLLSLFNQLLPSEQTVLLSTVNLALRVSESCWHVGRCHYPTAHGGEGFTNRKWWYYISSPQAADSCQVGGSAVIIVTEALVCSSAPAAEAITLHSED